MLLFFFLCSIISYKFNYVIGPNQTDITLPFKYGFQKGGRYSINISNGGNDSFLLTIKPFSSIYNYLNKNEVETACLNYTIPNHENIHVIRMNEGKYNLTGIINENTTYATTIKSCSNNHKGFFIELIYTNPDSPFSYDVVNALNFLLFDNYARIILFSIWLLNWLINFSLKNTLHLFITLTFFVFIVSKGINYLNIKKRFESNQITFVSKLSFVLNRLRDFFYMTTFFLINSGFCIINDSKTKSINKTIFMWCFYLIVFPILYCICNVYCFIIISFLTHVIINDIVMISDYVLDQFTDFYVLYQLKTIIYALTDFFEYQLLFNISSSDFEDFWPLYIFFEIFLMICNCIFAYSMKMNKDLKEDYIIAFTPDYYKASNPSKIYTFPKNATEISEERYINCQNIKTLNFKEGTRLIKINSFAFQWSSIEFIRIPPTVKCIGYKAFYDCKNLQFIEFMEESSILVFENFLEKSSINRINIPSSLVEIQDSWCLNVPNLNNISVSPLNHHFLYYNNDFILKKSNKYSNAFDVIIFSRRNIRNVTIPSYIKRINPNAFNQCTQIRSINFQFDSKLFFIGQNAFSESSITRITIPRRVTFIDKYAFFNCKKFKQIIFEKDSKLLNIDNNAFAYSSIESIQIPSSVIEINENAFLKCTKLKRISVLDDSNLMIIEKNAFNNTAITSFSVTSNVSFIRNDAFANCQNLLIVEFHENSKLCSIDIDIFSYSSHPILMVPAKIFQRLL